MSTEKFPLILWEETEEFKDLLQKDNDKLNQLRQKWGQRGGTCTYLGSLECQQDGEFKFWLNDNASICGRKLTLEHALARAHRHGDTGWWIIEDLADLLEDKGPIFEGAMWDNGFRRHKNKPNTWVRRRSDEKRAIHSQDTIYVEFSPEGDEAKRLKKLLILPNEKFKWGDTLSFIVGRSGLIFGCLNVNPFGGTTTESMPAWFSGYRVRGHFNQEQNGFSITATNLQIGEEKYIRIKTTGDGVVKECLWPTIIKRDRLQDVARYLVTGKL